MNKCPKCGGTNITNPHFTKNSYGHECLKEVCVTCGYIETRPTLEFLEQRQKLEELKKKEVK